jgi:hypothetical protein
MIILISVNVFECGCCAYLSKIIIKMLRIVSCELWVMSYELWVMSY